MDKRRISEEVYERYVDASVALFMEYYAASCLDKSEDPCTDEMEFPAELDTRCRALINREFARQRRKTFFKAAAKGLGVVACVAAVILSLSSVLFMTVEAVRIPIINYYFERGNGYWEIINEKDAQSSLNGTSINTLDPLAGLLATEYYPSEHHGTSLDQLVVIYKNPAGNKVFFKTEHQQGTFRIDTEDASTATVCNILGNHAVISVEENAIRLSFVHEESSLIVVLIADGLSKEEIISIAEQFSLILAS